MTKPKPRFFVALLSLGATAALVLAACAVAENPPERPTEKDDSAAGARAVVDNARAADGHLRLMAGNLTSGNAQAYEDPGIRIFQGVDPDVAMIQEVNVGGDSASELRSFVDAAFGTEFSYVRGAASQQIPNAIVSRYPILDSGEWVDSNVSNRDYLWARIDIPGPVDLYAISVHLLTRDEPTRNTEAGELVGHIQSFPAGSYVVLAGDFNTAVRSEAAIGTLASVLVTSGPYPVDQAGNENTNSARAKPYDWVLVNPALQAFATGVDVGGSTFPGGLVVDTRVFSPLADLAPAQTGDSTAVNMQHMGVVRDFDLSGGGGTPPAPTLQVTAPNGGETWAPGSTQAVRWTSSGVTSVAVELTTDGTTYTTLAASAPAAAGQLAFTVPATTSTTARVRVTGAGGGPSDSSDGTFSIGTAAPSAQVFLNEILANEPGSDTSREFVEVVNGGGSDADLSGWTLSDSTSVRHVFAFGTVLSAGQAIVVFGGGAAIPAGINGVAASTGTLALGNGGDTVTLASSGGTVDHVTYASALSSQDGVSMNRSPDATATGTFVLHTQLAGAASSPGTHADGSSYEGSGGTTTPPPPSDITAETEPNDSAETASGPVGAAAVTGRIASTVDADWYAVTFARAGTARVTVGIGTSADLDWYLYAEGDTTHFVARGFTSSNPETATATVAAGAYRVKVVGYRGAMAPYTLQVTSP